MCGIAGFIGVSKKPNFSNQLISKLFEKSEIRGIDAAGFWASQVEGPIFYHKEPQRSSRFVKNDLWQKALNNNLDLVMVHARGASKGVGAPEFNENNHPFVSKNKLISVVHNGRIEDKEYESIKENFELLSKCDSEVLLRIYEASEKNKDKTFDYRLSGIKDIFSLVKEGHMAVAIGEKNQDEKTLWLFRNQHRPLWVVDVRESLGQIFFVSEPSIWFSSVDECNFKYISKNQKIIELPPEEIWMLNINSKNICPNEIRKYQLNKDLIESWNDKNYYKVKYENPICEIITKLDDKDQVLNFDLDWEESSFLELEKYCDLIYDKIEEIKYLIGEKISEQSILKEDFEKTISLVKNQTELLEKLLSNL